MAVASGVTVRPATNFGGFIIRGRAGEIRCNGTWSKLNRQQRERLISLVSEVKEVKKRVQRIEFLATLKERGACRFDRDGAAEVKLETSADQLPSILKLTALAGEKLLRVTVEVED